MEQKKPPFTIYYYDAQLALAFQNDCQNLLDAFKQCRKLDFITFTEVWKEKDFIAIFKGQENILSVKTFIKNCFFITKKFLQSNDFYIQTGALYTLYGLYYKQPIKNWVKVLVTQSDLSKLKEITQIHANSGNLDPVYVFSKMRLDGAFHFSVLPMPLELDSRFIRRVDMSTEDINLKTSNESVLQKFKKLIEQDQDLGEFEQTDREYQKLAEKFREKNAKLCVFPSKVGSDLKRTYSSVYNVTADSDMDEDSPVKQLKNKAMTTTGAIYRGDKRVITACDLEEASTSSTK